MMMIGEKKNLIIFITPSLMVHLQTCILLITCIKYLADNI